MNKRPLGLFGAFFGLIFVLAACSGSSNPSTTSSAGSSSVLSTPARTSTTSSATTPTTAREASPYVRASSSPSSGAIDLATAFKNLQKQNSYAMTIKFTHVEGTFATIPGVTSQSTVKVERSGKDQHLAVVSSTDHTVFELWQIGGQVWVNIGAGPVKVAKDNSMVASFVAMLGADQQLMNSMESNQATYQVSGTDTVDGTQATVETAQYTASHTGDSMFLPNNERATVNSKIWVAQDGNYLLKGQFSVSGNAGATPASGMTTAGSPSATGAAQVMVSVSQVGKVQSIQPPS